MAEKEFLDGLVIYETHRLGEYRAEIRVRGSGEFVARFHSKSSLSNGVQKIENHIKVTRLKSVAPAKLTMVLMWLGVQVQDTLRQ